MCECVKRAACDKGKVILADHSYFYSDPCIRDVVQEITECGFIVTAACCGHNEHGPTITLSESCDHRRFDTLAEIIRRTDTERRAWTAKMWEPNEITLVTEPRPEGSVAIPVKDRLLTCEWIDHFKTEIARINKQFEIDKLLNCDQASLNRAKREGTSDGPDRGPT